MARQVEGIQGQGLASVWGDSPDFWRYATMGRQDQARAAKIIEDEKKARDKLIDDNLKFTPEKTWEPFYSEVMDLTTNSLRNGTKYLLERRAPLSEVQRFQWEAQGKINKAAAKSREYEAQFRELHDTRQQGEKGGFYQPGYYAGKINDMFFNGRQAKPLDTVDTTGSELIFNDSRGYNMANIAADFMKSLPQQLTEKYRKVASDLGEQFDVTTIKGKLGTKQNPDGSVKLDPRTGLPEIELTDDVTMAALDNPYIRNYVMDNLGAESMAPGKSLEPIKDLLAPVLTPYDQRAFQKQRREGFKYAEGDKTFGGGYSVPEPRVAERYDTLYRITHEHDPELLASILPGLSDNVDVAYEVYGPGESKKRPPRIVVTYPNKEWNKDVDGKEKREIRKVFSLETEEQRQAAMEFLNTAMDEKLDAKQRIGENLTNYRKKMRLKEKDKGGVYEPPGETSSETGGVY